MKQWLNTHRHAWMFLYFLIYLPWFAWLEKTVGNTPEYIIHMKLDDFIPFNEFFIIPYMLWFAFIAIAVLYFFFADSHEFYQLTCFLFIGMTIFLIVSTLFPNGQQLRPTEFARDNIFVELVKTLYTVDTPTNIAPSIHVYNTLCVWIAIQKSTFIKTHVKHRKLICTCTTILSVLIVLSTMFLKQHSAFDVITAFAMCGFFYLFIYRSEYNTSASKRKAKASIENI